MQESRSESTRIAIPFGSLVAAIAVVLFLLVPWAPITAAQDDDPIAVVTSFSVLADIVEHVGGDHVEVTSLVPVGGDAHTFDPAPDQIVAVSEADLIVAVGNDFEPWLDDLVESSGTSAPRYDAFGDAINHEPHGAASPAADHEHGSDQAPEGNEGEAHHDHAHDELHAWLNVRDTMHAVVHLAETLAEVDPDHAGDYTANAEAYNAELEELDSYIVEQTESIPEDQRLLITSHQTFGSFAAAYDYEIAGVLLESHSTEGADAPAGHVAELIEIIEERDIPAVFPDTPGGTEMLQPVADGAGVEIAPQLYVDTLGEEDSGAETYVDMMRHNTDTIVTALGS